MKPPSAVSETKRKLGLPTLLQLHNVRVCGRSYSSSVKRCNFNGLLQQLSQQNGIGSSLLTFASGDASPAPTQLKPEHKATTLFLLFQWSKVFFCVPKRQAEPPPRIQASNPSMLCCYVNRRLPRAGPGCGCCFCWFTEVYQQWERISSVLVAGSFKK